MNSSNNINTTVNKNKNKIVKEPEKKMTIIINNNPNIKNGFEENDNSKDNIDNTNENNDNNNGIEILEESRDYNTEGKYNREKKGKGGYYKNNYDDNYNNYNDKYNNYNDKYNNYNDKYNNYNDKYNDKYNNNYNDNYNNYNKYKEKDYYNGYSKNYKDYGGRNNYKGGYNDYKDYNDYNDYGKKSFKKKNYYK